MVVTKRVYEGPDENYGIRVSSIVSGHGTLKERKPESLIG